MLRHFCAAASWRAHNRGIANEEGQRERTTTGKGRQGAQGRQRKCSRPDSNDAIPALGQACPEGRMLN